MPERLRPELPGGYPTGSPLPPIDWAYTTPADWALPIEALGWGLGLSAWSRRGMVSQLDWFPVLWADRQGWQSWCTTDGIRLFVEKRLAHVLSTWPRVHAVGRPGSVVVLREALAIEMRFRGGLGL